MGREKFLLANHIKCDVRPHTEIGAQGVDFYQGSVPDSGRPRAIGHAGKRCRGARRSEERTKET